MGNERGHHIIPLDSEILVSNQNILIQKKSDRKSYYFGFGEVEFEGNRIGCDRSTRSRRLSLEVARAEVLWERSHQERSMIMAQKLSLSTIEAKFDGARR